MNAPGKPSLANACVLEPLESRLLFSGAGNIDFAAGIISSTVPASVASGDDTSMSMKVGISNAGDTAAPRGEKVYVDILARSDGQEDVTLASQVPVKVSGLKCGCAKTATVKFTLPSSLTVGTYSLVAAIECADDSDPGNNEAPGPSVQVEEADFEMSGVLGPHVPIPTELTRPANKPIRLTMPVTITNTANVAAKNFLVELIAFAGSEGIELGCKTVKSLAPGATVKVSVKASFRHALLPADYQLEINLEPNEFYGSSDIIDQDADGNSYYMTLV